MVKILINLSIFAIILLNLIEIIVCSNRSPILADQQFNRVPAANRQFRQNVNSRQNVVINDDSLLLPDDTIPISYEISIQTWIDTGNLTFVGTVVIELTAVHDTNHIVLHQRQLVIVGISVIDLSNHVNISEGIDHEHDYEREFLNITVPIGLSANTNYSLAIDYIGTLRDDNAGFYVSTYTNEAGNIVYLATTQFESTDARHGFPCYDEPAKKATFSIRITHAPSYTAISNMPEATNRTINEEDGTVTTIFQETVKMSTYLVAYIVSDFDFTSNENQPDVNIVQSVFARPNKVNETTFSVDVGHRLLTELENYLGVNYSLPKMDQVAVPDFAAGAMENWGLVTYREEYLLWDATKYNYITKTNIITIIAHEYAHQWFGNLVTPQWWTHIWLNEGFATLFEYYATDMVYPEMEMNDYFVVGVLQYVFQSDAIENVRPMTTAVYSPNAIDGLFDSVAYDKSGCVLRMLQHAVTDTSFQKGLGYYLKENEYKNVVEQDLYRSLELAVKEDATLPATLNIQNIMLTWTTQSGYPYIRVTRNYVENYVTIVQERYLSKLSVTPDPTVVWSIPYNFVTSENPNFDDTRAENWLTEKSRVIQSDPLTKTWTSDDWLIFNKQQTGYYRVLYDDDNWSKISNYLRSDQMDRIHKLSRSQLIDDAFNFARTNRLSYDIVFELTKYLTNEKEYVPWASAINGFSHINRMLEGTENYQLFTDHLKNLLINLYNTIGTADLADTESNLKKFARTMAINWACNVNLEACVQFVQTEINRLISATAEVHPNLKSAVYCNGLRFGNIDAYTYLYNRLRFTSDAAERTLIINSLGCTRNETLLGNFIRESIDNTDNYRNHERIRIINSVYQNSQLGVKVTIEFLITHGVIVSERFGGSVTGIMTGLAQRIVNDDQMYLFTLLLNSASAYDLISPESIQRCYEYVDENMNWISMHRNHIEEYLLSTGSTIYLSAIAIIFMLIKMIF